MKTKIDVIADAARPLITNTARANDLAHAVVGALMSAGYEIIRKEVGAPSRRISQPRRSFLVQPGKL